MFAGELRVSSYLSLKSVPAHTNNIGGNRPEVVGEGVDVNGGDID